jgi:imidazolonepropionase-like amidohydrolase
MPHRIAVVLLLAFVSLPAGSAAQVTAIRAGLLVDPDAGTAAASQVILVEDGRITAVGPGLSIPAGATVIDLSNATVSPGLVDAHAHLCMGVREARDAGSYYLTTLRDPDAYRAVQGVINARAMLESGFTTVRDIGNEGRYACVQVKRAIERGMTRGPTLITAGRILAPYGGQFQLQPDRRDLAEPEYFFADTRDEMVKAIRENIHYGSTVIKIVVDDQQYIYTADDIRFIKDEVHRAGLKLAAHAWTRAGAHNAADAGVDSIEHGFDMTDEDLRLAKANGVALVGTEYLGLVSSASARRQWVDRLARAYKVGVELVYGTDVIDELPDRTRGEESIRGIDVWVEAGVPAPAILKAMTTEAMRLLGLAEDRGAIRAGLAADLIATPGNPLDDITALAHVSFVMKNGVVVRHDRAPQGGGSRPEG